jgi:hypothetical protein
MANAIDEVSNKGELSIRKVREVFNNDQLYELELQAAISICKKINSTFIELPYIPKVGMIVRIEDYSNILKLTKEELTIAKRFICRVSFICIHPEYIILSLTDTIQSKSNNLSHFRPIEKD